MARLRSRVLGDAMSSRILQQHARLRRTIMCQGQWWCGAASPRATAIDKIRETPIPMSAVTPSVRVSFGRCGASAQVSRAHAM